MNQEEKEDEIAAMALIEYNKDEEERQKGYNKWLKTPSMVEAGKEYSRSLFYAVLIKHGEMTAKKLREEINKTYAKKNTFSVKLMKMQIQAAVERGVILYKNKNNGLVYFLDEQAINLYKFNKAKKHERKN